MPETDQLRERIEALEQQVSVSDARSSWLSDNLTAGYDGNFFLASRDEQFRLDINGQIQLRYILNYRDRDGGGTTSGFQHRRTKLGFTGRLANPDIRFRIRPVVSRNGGNVSVDDVWISYGLTDELTIKAGSFKLPFTRETIQSSTRLQTVERSLVNDTLGFGRSTGVEFAYDAGRVKLAGMFSDGAGSHFVGFQNSSTDYALTGRVDALLAGEWGYARDLSGYSDYGFGAVAGGAVHYDARNTDFQVGPAAQQQTLDFFAWTVDGSLYMHNVGIYAAVIGRHDTRVSDGADKYNDFGWLIQGGYMINDRIEPFARFEQLLPDNGRDLDDISLITAGLNYYFQGHSAKLTTDVVYALDPIHGFVTGSNGLGLLGDDAGKDGQIVWRTQFQLTF